MSKINSEYLVKAHKDVVWKVISDVAAFAEMAPNLRSVEILEGEELGMKRRCIDIHGKSWIEECTEWVTDSHYTMEVDTGDFTYPLKRMRRTWSVEEREDGTLLKMDYDYAPKYGLLGRLANTLYIRRRLSTLIDGLRDNWLSRIRDREWAYKVTVHTILQSKGNKVITAKASETVNVGANLLHDNRIGALLIVDDNDKLVGLVSERDIVSALAEHGTATMEQLLESVMTTKLVVCAPTNDMVFIMACMTDRRIRHLPVLDGEDLVGIISIGDVVKQRIFSLEAESETMREYIRGRVWRYHDHGTGIHSLVELRDGVGPGPL